MIEITGYENIGKGKYRTTFDNGTTCVSVSYTHLKYSKDYLPDRLSFSDIVDAILAGDQKAGEKICEYIYELFFYEIAAVKPVIINVLCYTILFMVFSRLIFWRQDYVYNVSFLFMYASVISMPVSYTHL